MVATDSSVLLADGDHVVQFFEDAEHLVGPVSGYLTASVLEGDAVIVLAKSAHCDMFRDALVASGANVHAAEAEGRLLMLDAFEIGRRLIIDGRLDVRAFDEHIARPVRQIAGGDRPIRVYGELVSVFWEEGNVAAAIDLERMWNQLGSEVPLALFCTYLSSVGPTATDAFSEVCGLHSEVRGHVSGTTRADATRSFDGTPQAVRLARSFVVDTLRAWGRHDLIDDGALVASEFAANAVVHARSDFTVGLTRRNGWVRIEVGDSSVDSPRVRDQGASMTASHGLYLVDKIARRWGHGLVPDGKVVWAEIAVPEVVLADERGGPRD